MSTLRTTNLKNESSVTNNIVLGADGSINLDAGTLYVDAANNKVGVGTTSPARPLDVVSDSGARAIQVRGRSSDNIGLIDFHSNDGTTRYASIGAPAASQFAIETGNTEKLRIDGSGRLLVGTSSSSGNYSLEVNGAIKDSAGATRSIPQNSQASAYVLTASDTGKHISITTGGVTVPAGVFNTGDVVSIYNNSGSSQTITQGSSTTLRQAGTANTGNRTLAQYGLATVLCVASNTFVISGSGLS